MTYEETTDYLDSLPGVLALFWFMENVNEDDPHRSELFFYCRERARRYSFNPNAAEQGEAWKAELKVDAKLFKLHFED